MEKKQERLVTVQKDGRRFVCDGEGKELHWPRKVE